MEAISRSAFVPPTQIRSSFSFTEQLDSLRRAQGVGPIDLSVVLSATQEGNLLICNREIELEVKNLNIHEDQLRALLEEHQEAQEKIDDKMRELSRWRVIDTSVGSFQYAAGIAAGAAIGGASGGIMIGGALLGAAHQIASKVGLYEKVGQSLASQEIEQRELGHAIENGVGLVSFLLGAASFFCGGGAALQEGVKLATTAGQIGQAAQGLVGIKKARIESEKTNCDVEFMETQAQIQVRRLDRDETQNRMENSFETLEKQFGTVAQVTSVLMQLNQRIISQGMS